MRSSGTLLHISSLPSHYGIGSLGKSAYEFVDFLKTARQSYWQVLPIGPTGYGNSPYQSFSTFAGNHYFIDLDQLAEDGLLQREELENVFWGSDEAHVDFGILYEKRLPLLRRAYQRFSASPDSGLGRFIEENHGWLEDYALFMAVKHHFNDRDWSTWDEDIRLRDEHALDRYRELLRDEIGFHCFLQYMFFRQWGELRLYAHQNGIHIIGDLPIYVPMDSADVWSQYRLFQLDENRRPISVAGCPPDYFSADGQLWGNPLYDWDKLHEEGYSWWLGRIGAASKCFDVIRIDHFRGFESYWSIPYGDKTARGGKWVKGPGIDLIRAIRKSYPALHFIAEDLGSLTPEVTLLREDSGFPGMKVLEFAFDSHEPSTYLPHNYTRDCVCYTGTHDNATLCQWFDEISEEDLLYTRNYLGLCSDGGDCSGMLRTGMGSVADLFVAQLQDYLELGEEARMNLPGTLNDKNWCWRVLPSQLSESLSQRIGAMTKLYGRDTSNLA